MIGASVSVVQSFSQKKIAESASLTPSDTQTSQSTTFTLQGGQSAVPTSQNTTITTPQITPVNIQGNPSGTDISTEEQSEKSESFKKGEDAGKLVKKQVKF